jgi:ParB/RepB/Spo0J family partition protein
MLKTIDDLFEIVKRQKDSDSICLLLQRLVHKSLQEKYRDEEVTVEISDPPYIPKEPACFVCVRNDGLVVESFTKEQGNAFVIDVVDVVDGKHKVTDEEGFNRIWKLYKSCQPEEVTEKIEILTNNEIINIPVNKITPYQGQIRENFDDVEFIRLSFMEIGQIKPIVVTETDGGYEIVDGEKRWRAAKLLSWSTIKAIVLDKEKVNSVDDISMASNFGGRSNPNPIALAKKIAKVRIEVKKTNCWGKEKDIIPEEERKKLDLNNVFLSHPAIDSRIEKKWGISKKRQQALVELLKQHPQFQEKIAKGELNIAEDIYTINLDKDDFGEEFIKAVKDNIRKNRQIDRIEKEARNTNNPDAKFLKYYAPIEKLKKQITLSDTYFDQIDTKTFESVRERSKNLINELMTRFNIGRDEL